MHNDHLYNKVIVPLDGSTRAADALAPAGVIATTLGIPVSAVGIAPATMVDTLRAEMSEQAAAAGLTAAEILTPPTEGSVAEDVLRLVREHPGALVCMSSTGRSHTGAAIGSVGEAIIAKSGQPVLLVGPEVRPDAFHAGGRLVIAVDGSPEAEDIIEPATDWSGAFDLRPEIVEATGVDTPAVLAAASAGGADAGSETAYVARLAAGMRSKLGRVVDFDVLHDSKVDRAILEHLRDAALVAMTTHTAVGLHRLMEGSVSMSVVHKAHCPVLVAHRDH